MKPLKILLIEDDPFTQEDIREALESFGHEVVGIADSFERASELVESFSFIELAFIDIQLRTSFDGIDVASMLREKTSAKLIFLTSLTDSRIVHHAKRLKIDGYLVKPFKEEDIRIAIEMLDFENAIMTEQPTEIYLKSGHELLRINLGEILYAEAQDNYVFIYTEEKRQLFHMTLKDLEAKINSSDFIRSHRSFLINRRKIEAISANYVRINKKEIPINENTRKLLGDFT
jgi:DNA-binding LytR/AlgR family response regulator